MKITELLKNIPVLCGNYPADLEINDVCYDSRKVQPGTLFAAVSGFQTDGHKFIDKAVENGASAVLCERVPECDIPYILVKSTRAALPLLGVNMFGDPSSDMTVIGVTGTNGKTSSTIILKSVLEQTLGAKVGLIGTIQNMIGEEVIPTERTTPESYDLQRLFGQMRDAGCTHVVMEVSSHALCLNRVDGIDFAVGAFTNLTEDHLDFHKTMEAYGAAKAMLFRKCRIGVINADDPWAALMAKNAACELLYTSAAGASADCRAESVCLNSDSVEMKVTCRGETAQVRVGIPGQFTVSNVLTVLGCTTALGIPLKSVVEALAHVKGVNGRIEVVPTPGKPYTVLIDYAHTPDALDNILRSVRSFCRGRLIAVFGCGGDRDPIKRPIMGRIGLELADMVIYTSDNPRTEDPMKILADILEGTVGINKPYFVEESREKAIAMAMDMAREHDIIVLAGKGHETYQIRGTVKFHLDEREVVAAYLNRQ